jgi:ABC-type glutathione transport system ATPase component
MQDNNQLIRGPQIEPENQTGFGEKIDTIRQKVKKPIQITWKNIRITAVPPKPKCKKNAEPAPPKEIIRDVSGTVKPGEFLAIIGASGKCSTASLHSFYSSLPRKG